MSLKTTIRQYLIGKQTVTALCGLRIYPSNIPQKSLYPAVVISIIGVTTEHHLQGISGYAESRVQIDSHALLSTQADELDEAIRKVFMLPTNYDKWMLDIHVDRIQDDDANDLSMPPADGSDSWMYRIQHDYIFSHTQSTS